MDAGRIGRARHTSSLYDYVKVRVFLGDQAEASCHSHVLSRFLIARTLMATQVPFATAVKVALEVKKHLVDNDQLNVTQAQLEAAIFMFLRRRGLPEDCIFQYRLLSSFHQRRQALVILIAGSVLCHKSAIASQLSQRMNLGNVLNVDCVARLMLQPNANERVPASTQDGSAQSSFALRYHAVKDDMDGARAMWASDCDRVFEGIKSDLGKCLNDGKSIVASGLHLNLHECVSRVRALVDASREIRYAPIILPFFVVATDRELLHAVTSSDEERMRVAFIDDLVKPFSGLGKDEDTHVTLLEASQTSLPNLLSSVHAHVLKSIRESLESG